MWSRQCSSLVSSARTSRLGDAGIVDEDRDRPMRLLDLGRGPVDVRGVGHVQLHAMGDDAEPFSSLTDCLDPLRHQVGHDHRRARLAQRPRTGRADALPAARHHRHAAVEPQLLEIHAVLPQSMSRED